MDCATWENDGLSWLFFEEDEEISYWGAWVKQPCFRFCGIPQPYPEKVAAPLPWEADPTREPSPTP